MKLDRQLFYVAPTSLVPKVRGTPRPMRIDSCHWQQVEEYLKHDDRCVIPLGCTEQHAYLSLATDSLLAFKVAVEAAEPLRVAVFPVQPYGVTPTFVAFPGTVSLRVATLGAILVDILSSLSGQGFRRFLFVNGHGGNTPCAAMAHEWAATCSLPGVRVAWHDWWNGPLTRAKVNAIDPDGTHANWMENFPWTRLEGVTQPEAIKPMVDYGTLRGRNAEAVRQGLGDGSFGGAYQRPDADVLALWEVGLAETRQLIESL